MLLIDAGANILAVSQRLGHSEPSVTMNVYGHLYEDRQKELTDSIDRQRGSGASRAEDEQAVARIGDFRRTAEGGDV